MIQRNFKLALTAGRTIPLVIPASQYDSGEQWIFTLIDETGAKYTPESGAIIGIKSDKMAILNAGTVDAAGRVVINETEQMTAAVGKNVYEILINDQTHGSANFIVMVEPRPGDNADFSDSDLSLLQQAIDGTSETAIKAGVQEWMDDNLTSPTNPIVDASLSISGAAADAKKTGDEISSLKSAIGNLNNLETEVKTDLVSAINEAAQTGGSGSGLTAQIKQALLNIFQHVMFVDDEGDTAYDALEEALGSTHATAVNVTPSSLSFGTLGSTQQLTATLVPSDAIDTVTWSSSDTSIATVSSTGLVTSVGYGNAVITATAGTVSKTVSVIVAQASVTSIDAVYTQSGTVYDNASLDSLKANLVVTAHWSNNTTTTVPSTDYELSGTLTAGTSTVTVSYGGKTATFNVTVTELVRVTGWYYPFADSADSYGTKDFDFTGNATFATIDGRKCYVKSPDDSDSSLKGLVATGLNEVPNLNGDFTVSFWYKSQTAKYGNSFNANKWYSSGTANLGLSYREIATGWTSAITNPSKTVAGFVFRFDGTNFIVRVFDTTPSNGGQNLGVALPDDFDTTAWHHYALTRSSGDLRLFIDGSQIWRVASLNRTLYFPDQVSLGNAMGNTQATINEQQSSAYGGYMADLYINDTTAKWTSNFDPSNITY